MSKKITVSDKFVKIWNNFNIFNQVENMRELSRKELLLLLMIAIDDFAIDSRCNLTVMDNFIPFQKEIEVISNTVFDNKFEDVDLKKIYSECESLIVERTMLKDSNDDDLKEPLDDSEVISYKRSLTIKKIINT